MLKSSPAVSITANKPDHKGVRPIHLAVSKGFFEICVILDDEGADLHACDDDGWGCLHYAGLHGSLAVTEWLLERFVDAEHTNNEGLSAFKICKYRSRKPAMSKDDIEVDEDERQETMKTLHTAVYGF